MAYSTNLTNFWARKGVDSFGDGATFLLCDKCLLWNSVFLHLVLEAVEVQSKYQGSNGSIFPRVCAIYVRDENVKFKVEIPLSCNKKLEGLMDEVKIGRTATNKTWTCDVTRVRHENGEYRLMLWNGWKQIFIENKIEMKDTVTFVYLGNSVFNLNIVEQDCVIKAPTCGSTSTNSTVRERGGGGLTYWGNDGHALNSANLFLSNSLYEETFVVKLTQSYQKTYSLPLPLHFARRCLKYTEYNVLSVILLRGITQWNMEMRFYKNEKGVLYNCIVTNGFRKFIMHYKFLKNDVLAFELVDNDDPTIFKVKMFQTTEPTIEMVSEDEPFVQS